MLNDKDFDKLDEAIKELRLMDDIYEEPMLTPQWVLNQLDEVREILRKERERKWWHI